MNQQVTVVARISVAQGQESVVSGRANGELFAELFPLSSQALAFEDSLPGVKAASDAGIFTVGIATTQTTERLLAAGARWVIEETTHGCGR